MVVAVVVLLLSKLQLQTFCVFENGVSENDCDIVMDVLCLDYYR